MFKKKKHHALRLYLKALTFMGYYTLHPLKKAFYRVGKGIIRPNSPCWKGSEGPRPSPMAHGGAAVAAQSLGHPQADILKV